MKDESADDQAMLRLRKTWPDTPGIFTVIYPHDGYDYRVGSIALGTGLTPPRWTWTMNMLVAQRLPLTTRGTTETRDEAMQEFRGMWTAALLLIPASDFDRARKADADGEARRKLWLDRNPPGS